MQIKVKHLVNSFRFTAHHESFFYYFYSYFCSVFPYFSITLVQCVVTRWCFFDRILPHYKLFETQAQFIVVTEELRVRWDLIQEDLGHLQWALQRGSEERRRGVTKTKQHSRRDKERESKNSEEEGKRGGKRGSV